MFIMMIKRFFYVRKIKKKNPVSWDKLKLWINNTKIIDQVGTVLPSVARWRKVQFRLESYQRLKRKTYPILSFLKLSIIR